MSSEACEVAHDFGLFVSRLLNCRECLLDRRRLLAFACTIFSNLDLIIIDLERMHVETSPSFLFIAKSNPD